MNPGDISSAQDVYCCDLCKRPDFSLVHCDVCRVNLCKTCVGEHLFDKSLEHRVVAFENRGFTCNFPKCKVHPPKLCEHYCKRCEIPICASCISSTHAAHARCDILSSDAGRKIIIRNDLHELQNSILPIYQKAASELENMTDNICQQFQRLKKDIKTQGEDLHREVDNIVQDIQTKMGEIESKTMANANSIKTSINQTINQISKAIENLKGLLISSPSGYFSALTNYKPENEKFRKPPPSLKLSFPKFTPGKIDREQINQLFGFLENLALNTDKECSGKLGNQFIGDSRILADLKTDNSKSTIACLSNDEFWTCGENKVATLYNFSNQIESLDIKSLSGVEDVHVAVTLGKVLVFTGSKKIFKHEIIENSSRPKNAWVKYRSREDEGIQTLITLSKSIPLSVCCTSSGHLLVIMTSRDKKQTKVVRYCGSEEIQTIQWDDQWMPLYSSGGNPDIKYITENKNFDICVADNNAKAVVVVSGPGKLRFRYLGVHFSTEETFDPFGITTDSRRRILIADKSNRRIHILDQDGQFLRFIHGWKLRCPRALCIDSEDNLFVTLDESIQKIRYYE